MLALDSPLWSELRHAYGSATDIPRLLRTLHGFPDECDGLRGPWFELWSALCHQDTVYPASFAAVPHIVGVLAADPAQATMSFFLLPASIEIARNENGTPVPPTLEPAYRAALARLPALAGAAAHPGWDAATCASALAASAAATGQLEIARLLLQVEGEDIPEVLRWLAAR